MFGLDVDTLRNIRKTIAQFPHIEKVLIYGSRAKGNYKTGSDIDITLIAKDLTLKNSVYPLSTALDDLYLPYTFDISIFDQLENPDFVDHILRVGKTFYQKENNVRKGWKETTIGDVCELYQPKTISKKEMTSDGKYLVFGANGIIGRYNKFNHEESQLLITCRGATCGSVNISEPQSWITGNAMVVRPKVAELSLKFLEYLFRGSVDLTSVISGAAQPQITRKSLSPVTIYYPPLAEQKRIVAVLDEAFATMATATANTKKNIANAKELFDSALHSVFQHPQPAEDSVSDVTAEWQKAALGEVCEFRRGLTYKKSDEVPVSKNAILRANNITVETGEINFDEIRFINDEINIPLSKKIIHGCLLVCTASGSKKHLGKIGIVETGSDYAFGGFMGILVPAKRVLPKYLFYLTRSDIYRDFIDALSDGMNINNLKWSQLSQFQVPLPPLPEQQRIATFLDKLSAEKQTLVDIYKTKIRSLAELKQSMLHQAFTGELTSK